MNLWYNNKYFLYIKSISACIVLSGSCWLIYQARETSQILRSILSTNVLDLEKTQAQYIYLDDPRFKDILTSQDDLQSSATKKYHESFTTIIIEWWKSINHNLSYRLLHLAKTGQINERLKAVDALGSLKHLKDWHYCHLAQMMDAKTAIALSRISNSNLKFFLKPPKNIITKNFNDTVDDIYQLLLKLDQLSNGNHRCLTKFINEKFQDYQRDNLVFDHDLPGIGLSTTSSSYWDKNLLKNCIKAIYHHTSIENFNKDILLAHGLSILVDVKNIFSNDIEVLILVAKIISNLSLHLDCIDELFVAGWIGILAEWSRNEDVRLAAPSARALANLDTDTNENNIYSRRIYLLHPMYRDKCKKKIDICFIHGLLGGVFVTWRQRDNKNKLNLNILTEILDTNILNQVIGDNYHEFIKDLSHDYQIREWNKLGNDFEFVLDDCPVSFNSEACGTFTCSGNDYWSEKLKQDHSKRTECWPKDWLPKDLPGIRVLGINYDTSLTLWTLSCPIERMKNTMDGRSEEFINKLILAGVGKRPIVWICHSMGGLIVKKMLVEEWNNGDKNKICKNTKSIIFYSTPHRGSHVAALKQLTEILVWPSIEVQELRQESPKLLKLHDEFLNMLKHNKIDIISFGETIPTPMTALKFSLQFVTSKSADPGIGEFYEIPQNHLTICKPASRSSFLYKKVIDVIKKHTYKNNELTDKSNDNNLLTWLFRIF